MKSFRLAAAGWAGLAAAAAAQPADPAFTGTHAGGEAGVVEHHFFLGTLSGGTTIDRRYHRSRGAGGGVFAGHDLAVSPRLRVGAVFANGTSLALKPRYGYRLTLRGGAVVGSGLLVYATGGYGGNRYRIGDSAGVTDVHEWGSSFVVGAGAEYRLSRRAGLRLDYKHVDNQTHHFFVGVPVRF
jgi:outer membrane immunogenic protein